MSLSAVRSKAVALLLLIIYLLLPHWGLGIGLCFVMSVLSVLSSFAIILLSERASYFNVIVFLCWFAVCDCGIS